MNLLIMFYTVDLIVQFSISLFFMLRCGQVVRFTGDSEIRWDKFILRWDKFILLYADSSTHLVRVDASSVGHSGQGGQNRRTQERMARSPARGA